MTGTLLTAKVAVVGAGDAALRKRHAADAVKGYDDTHIAVVLHLYAQVSAGINEGFGELQL